MDVRTGSAFPVWTCGVGHVNDKLRNPCRTCHEYQPCDQWLDDRTCGARPTRAIPNGIKCVRCLAVVQGFPAPLVDVLRTPRPVVDPRWPVRTADQLVPVVDGRRPEIDRLTLGPPDSVRKAAKVARETSWLVWTAVMVDAGTKGRPKALLVAYRGPETVVASWEQDANLTWKPKGGTHWAGRRPARYGEQSWTALMGVIRAVGRDLSV